MSEARDQQPERPTPKPRENESPSHPQKTSAAAPEGPICDLCGSPMYERHCRIICPTCGYQRDCSDP